MITYEITALVRGAEPSEYERYMRERHIPDLMGTGCFAGATFSRGEGGRYRIRYEAPDVAALERYLGEHAPRLREHFEHRFGAGVQLTRESWQVLERWDLSGAPARPKSAATPQEGNEAEWRNPENWSGALVGVYFSKRDTRVWVPKRVPRWGWTLNLGNPAAAWWLVGLLAIPPLLAVAISGRAWR